MLTLASWMLSGPSFADDACADLTVLAEPAAAGELTRDQDACLQRLADHGEQQQAVEAATLLWHHLRAANVDDERRFGALRRTLDRSAPHGVAMLFARSHVGETVLVDGIDMGRSPVRIPQLAEGPHTVQIGTGEGAVTVELDFRIEDAVTVVSLN